MNSDARSAMLGRIRSALGESAASLAATAGADWESIPRDYDQVATLIDKQKLELLEDRLRDYDAEVNLVANYEIPSAIADTLKQRNHPRMLIPAGFPNQWLPSGESFTEDAVFNARELDAFDGVLTTATLAIAETGTLVLQNAPGQGRRAATLVPDFHLCIVRADDIVENVPEAFARLEATCTLPTTFVSGPSATADIEMTRIKGVHGPRFLHVLIALDVP